MFTVLGAYHLVKELQDNKGRGGNALIRSKGRRCEMEVSLVVEVPQVVKTFMWRSFNNALPTKPSLLS
jgi:hypothetical protein